MAVIKVVALDMVGVVLDEERIVSTTLYDLLPRPTEISRSELKARYDDGLRLGHLSPAEFWADAVNGDWVAFERDFLAGLSLVPGVDRAIEEYAKSFTVTIVSDLPEKWAKIVLDCAGLSGHISRGAFADQHGGARKKDGALFRALQQEFGLPFEQFLVVDDTVANVRAAEALGMPAVWFRREGRESDGAPIVEVRDFEGLDNALRRYADA
jgi:FMN phosphatase YigB (HAD superfamily)